MIRDIHSSFVVRQSPEQVFAAISDVRAWWSGQVEGRTDGLGEEFSYTVPDIHYSKFSITDYTPNSRIAWLVTDSWLTFVEDHREWDGTTVVFEITPSAEGTRVDFTHRGLTPEVECFVACNDAWRGYVTGSLRELIEAS